MYLCSIINSVHTAFFLYTWDIMCHSYSTALVQTYSSVLKSESVCKALNLQHSGSLFSKSHSRCIHSVWEIAFHNTHLTSLLCTWHSLWSPGSGLPVKLYTGAMPVGVDVQELGVWCPATVCRLHLIYQSQQLLRYMCTLLSLVDTNQIKLYIIF